MASRKTPVKKNNSDNFFILSIDKKKKIAGIFLGVFALILLLSILSYTRSDSSRLSQPFADLFKVFSSNPDFISRAEQTQNWLGIFGAYISNFLINSTVGFFAIVFPVISFIWGYSIIKDEDYKLPIYLTNFLLIAAIILSSIFGVLRYEYEVFLNVNELSGKIGDFFGIGLGRFLGGLGSLLLLFTLFIISLIIAFDIKFGKVLQFIKGFWEEAFDETENEEAKEAAAIKPDDNIEKIKKLNKKPKRKKTITKGAEKYTDPEKVQSTTDELDEDTRITIVKKEGPEEVVEPEPFETDVKLVDDVKPQPKDDIIIDAVDKDKEAELPDQWEEELNYKTPKIDILDKPAQEDIAISEDELKTNAELLKEKLKLFDIKIDDISVTPGPVVTLYEIVPSPDVKISRIVGLEHDIALALAARGIRIIAPIPGKSAIGVEIPNAEAATVYARTVISKIKESKAVLPLALGKMISGDVYITDLSTMPHLLIAGSTGSGKSVGINMMIASLLYAKHPSEIKFVMIDPKKIELSFYKKLTKHFLAVSPDLEEEVITNSPNALLALKAVEYEMDKRYNKLAKMGVRNIIDYNKKVADPAKRVKDTPEMKHHKLPYIILIIDELADLMITAGKEVEAPIARLAQLARAVGIHLIVATQRPSVNVITGVIKANFSARIAYQVATKVDSRTILDMNGAEQLLGRGDMLFLPGGLPKPVRIQNAFITTEEVEELTNSIYVQKGFSKRYLLPSMFEKKKNTGGNFLADVDPEFEEAARVIVRHQQGSVSLLQRRLSLGYARAARIVDQLEQAGIVGASMGSKAREVLVENEEQLETILRSL
ncbi:MAG: DNA translocase FtsK [Ignavibacteriae bacterium]|jgi:S-DNA-T family DNA segregation ATPase FtsK/SpoIIIE|nr:DNA translocase FtsK [Ignavibacteriota bacterium]NOG96917.1 DNA translocase FtsK [Ignavibacteriota bacterium]